MEDRILENENNSKEFRVLDIYYKTIKFDQPLRKNGNCKLEISHKFEFQKASDCETIRTIIITTIKAEDLRIDFLLQTVGIFKIECSEKIDRKFSQMMIDILYPYTRMEIQLLTTQPGIIPIMLPVIAPRVNFSDNDSIFN